MIGKSLLHEFQSTLGTDNVFHEDVDRLSYSYDAAVLDPVLPDLILRPVSSEALGRAIRLCNENSLPLTVRGAGTNLSGGTIPAAKGVVILTTALNKIWKSTRPIFTQS